MNTKPIPAGVAPAPGGTAGLYNDAHCAAAAAQDISPSSTLDDGTPVAFSQVTGYAGTCLTHPECTAPSADFAGASGCQAAQLCCYTATFKVAGTTGKYCRDICPIGDSPGTSHDDGGMAGAHSLVLSATMRDQLRGGRTSRVVL
jgi:hypothetical protein